MKSNVIIYKSSGFEEVFENGWSPFLPGGAAASFDRDILDRGVVRRDKGLPGKIGPSFAPASELLDGTFEI